MFPIQNLLSLTVLINVVLISAKETEVYSAALHRSRRQLLYPNSTVLQFNAGIGFPTGAMGINVNYAFQANFQLPWNRTQIPVDILHANGGYIGTAKKKRETSIRDDENGDYQDEAKLYHFYKHVETVLDGLGYNGQLCVLQTLCQLGAEPLHSDDEEDLLHEIASFVLNPTNDASHTEETDENFAYIKAYKDGENHQDCNFFYKGCSLSLIDVFTKLHDVS